MSGNDLSDDPLLAGVPVHKGYKVLGGVVLHQKLGQGGMGAVYRGRHLRLNVDVAVKVMAAPLALSREQKENYVKRFIREAQTAASISHQNLVRVMDVNNEGDIHYLVMECVEGESAGERLERKGKLAEQEVVEIALGAAEGLAEAHAHGIVHRDVKPDNILIDKRGKVKVTDLGLAKAISGEGDSGGPSVLTETQVGMGTPYYMSPEQFTSAKTVGAQADVWSLGVTLYQLLTGKLPWTDSNVFSLAKKIEGKPAPDAKSLCDDLSDGICSILEKALQKDAAERYADCGEMAKRLREHFGAMIADESLLPDAKAGSTKLALVSVTPPATDTMTLIEKSALVRFAEEPGRAAAETPERASDTAATVRPVVSKLPGWAIPAVAVGGMLLLFLILWAILADREKEPTPQARAVAERPLEGEAVDFFVQVLRLVDSEELNEAKDKIKEAGTRYDATTAGPKIARLAETIAAKLAARRRREEEEKEAEARERREEARKDEARRLAARKNREIERTLDEIAGKANAGEWREAWGLIEEARKVGMIDPRLDSLAGRAARALAPPKRITGPLGIELVLIPGGTFRMGSSKGRRNEQPVHSATLSPFYVGRYEITKAQFEAFKKKAKRTLSRRAADRMPVVSVSWQEACDFCRYVANIDPALVTYRLPTEAEWEFTARGENATTFPWGNERPTAKHANLSGKEDGFERLAPIGSYPKGATPEGVMDLVGNAAEWCLDWYGRYPAAPQIDPTGLETGKERVVRGSAWAYDAKLWSRASARAVGVLSDRKDTLGFRVVRVLTGQERMFLNIVGDK